MEDKGKEGQLQGGTAEVTSTENMLFWAVAAGSGEFNSRGRGESIQDAFQLFKHMNM